MSSRLRLNRRLLLAASLVVGSTCRAESLSGPSSTAAARGPLGFAIDAAEDGDWRPAAPHESRLKLLTARSAVSAAPVVAPTRQQIVSSGSSAPVIPSGAAEATLDIGSRPGAAGAARQPRGATVDIAPPALALSDELLSPSQLQRLAMTTAGVLLSAGIGLLGVRRLGGRFAPLRPRADRGLQSHGSIPIGPRNALHLVEIAGRQFLVAVDPRGVSSVTAVPPEFPPPDSWPQEATEDAVALGQSP